MIDLNQAMYSEQTNPPVEGQASPVSAKTKMVRGFNTVTIDGKDYEIVSRKYVERIENEVEKLRRELKMTRTEISRMGQTMDRLQVDHNEVQRAVNRRRFGSFDGGL